MSASMEVWIEGIGFWAQGLPDWPSLRERILGQPPRSDAPDKPAAEWLAPAERRRAPALVRLAIEAATQAVRMSGRPADQLPSVFTSAHGDAIIMDYMCRTLAEAPRQLSPTRFHNSVHNAAAGYWTIAARCMQASSAVCAGEQSFGAGLMEAATQAICDRQPLLLVASDAPASGPLAEVIRTRQPMGCALVLSPEQNPRAVARLRLQLGKNAPLPNLENPGLATLFEENACGHALLLLACLTGPMRSHCRIPCGTDLALEIETESYS
jgi:hypothetical protein